MVEDYGEEFSAEPGADDFLSTARASYRTTQESCRRRAESSSERSPVDYLAYLLALKDLKRDDVDFVAERALPLITEAVRGIWIGLCSCRSTAAVGIELPDAEDPKLRRAVDARLVAIFGAR